MARNIRSRTLGLVGVAITVVAAQLAGSPPAGAVSDGVVISQIYGGGGNSGATYTHDFIELFNRGDASVSLEGMSLQYASATGTGNLGATSTQLTELTGVLAPGGYLLVQESTGGGGTTPLPTADIVDPTPIAMAAASGKVVVAHGTDSLGCNGGSTPCTAAQLARMVDVVGYGSANFFEGSSAAPTLSNTSAALRDDNGATDTDDNGADFTAGPPNPRNSGSVPPPPDTDCDTPATHEIAAVQGSGAATPLAGQQVRLEGVVTGDFQNSTELGGFFLQDDTPDADPATSDGIFAAAAVGLGDVAVGDRVLVSGTASESFGLTSLAPVSSVDVCGAGGIAPAPYDLPRTAGVEFEPHEGVLLTFPETLTATEHFQLGRFGEVSVSSDGRLFQPTEQVEPGPAAVAAAEEAARRRLLIDDGSNVQNPDTVPYLTPDVLRIGDTASGITGVLSFGFSRYRLQPTEPITFTRSNPRPAAPAPVGGDIRVASFNALNYFTTLGSANPNARGADTAAEFTRQQAKLVAALAAIDADVVGLMEIENNGATALDSLVDALNAATAPGTYAAVTEPALNPPNEFGGTFGTDAIKVALIYRPEAVTPIEPARSAADAAFDRPPLIQKFQRTGGSGPITIAVNHFKSKSCGGATGSDQDQGDGQACYNARRVAQATALADMIGAVDAPDTLLVGDLNSYRNEDPLDVLATAGYTGLTEEFVADNDAYSFVFDGFSGELDHALAGTDLLDNVTGATIWHINADEPLILDYNVEFNPPQLYQPDAYRSSDHDPLIVGLDLDSEPAAPAVAATPGWGAATVTWEAPSDGGSPITGYQVRLLGPGGDVVHKISAESDFRSATFGGLTDGVDYTAEVTATNEFGASPAGTATVTPFVPATYLRIEAGVACPAFTATNPNPFPVDVTWNASAGVRSGSQAVPADTTATLAAQPASRGRTVLVLFAGSGDDRVFQSRAIASCAD